jgi:protein-disulfide isomerase
MLGSAQAPDTIIEFSDYECPSCAAAQSTLREFEQRHPGRVVVVFRHFPLSSIHPRAAEAAGAAVCAEEQGRFREMSELLFESQQSLGAVPWKDLALRSGVPSLVDFQACMGSQRPLQRVAVDVEAGHQIGVEGTPSFLIGDRLYAGRLALAELEAALNE